MEALNLFIDDVYHDRKIVRDGVVPADVIDSSEGYRAECIGIDPPRGVWCHITGTDLVRGSDGTIYVLEDNLRSPSGVSYVLENRAVTTATFPLFEGLGVRPVIDYPSRLLSMLEDGFLLLNREFPRSVHHCVNQAQISLHAVTGTPIRRFANTAERALGQLVAELDYTDIVDAIRSGLHDFLDAIQDKLNGVGNEITHTFFAQRWRGESLR